MNILLTGSSGMVGRNILEHQNADDYKILNPTSAELNFVGCRSNKSFLKNSQTRFNNTCSWSCRWNRGKYL